MAERHRNWYAPTLLGGLAAAVAVAVGADHPWATGAASIPGIPVVRVGVDGAALAPLAAALGYVLLAGFGAVVATRGRVRLAVGAAIVVSAVVVAIQVVVVPSDVGTAVDEALRAKGYPGGGSVSHHTSAWRWVCLTGALVALAAGLLVVRFGREFAVMGAKYDPVPLGADPVATSESTEARSEAEIWRALDRGDDPTGQK